MVASKSMRAQKKAVHQDFVNGSYGMLTPLLIVALAFGLSCSRKSEGGNSATPPPPAAPIPPKGPPQANPPKDPRSNLPPEQQPPNDGDVDLPQQGLPKETRECPRIGGRLLRGQFQIVETEESQQFALKKISFRLTPKKLLLIETGSNSQAYRPILVSGIEELIEGQAKLTAECKKNTIKITYRSAGIISGRAPTNDGRGPNAKVLVTTEIKVNREGNVVLRQIDKDKNVKTFKYQRIQ